MKKKFIMFLMTVMLSFSAVCFASYGTDLDAEAKAVDQFFSGTDYKKAAAIMDAELAKAVEAQKYASKHVKTNWLKFYMDGTVESGTGFIDPPYTDGHQGLVNWTEDEFTPDNTDGNMTEWIDSNETGSITVKKNTTYELLFFIDGSSKSCSDVIGTGTSITLTK